MRKPLLMAVLVATTILLGGIVAQAAVVVLNFEGLQDHEAVNDFYNGGTGSLGSSGTNYGINFSTNSLAIIDADAPGGTGNFANEPSPSTILFFLSGGAATMNVAAGFTTGFSFFYANDTTLVGSVTVYDGLNATGNVLASLVLPLAGVGLGDPNGGTFGVWLPVGVAFNGTAKSVDFAGSQNQIGFDDVTLGSEIPNPEGDIPEPASIVIWTLLAGAVFCARRFRARG